MSYSSQVPYGSAAQSVQQAPQNPALGAPARVLSDGMAHVANQFAAVWGAQERAQQVNEAAGWSSKLAMQADDLVRGFETDPDPATVPQRSREKLAEWKAAALENVPEAVRPLVQRHVDTMLPQAYHQIATGATRRTTEALRGGMADSLGTDAQTLAAAPDEPSTLAAVGRMKATIAGNEHAGVIPQGSATAYFSRAVRQSISIKAATDPLAAQAMLDRFKPEMDAADVAALTTSLRAPVEGRQDEQAAQGAIGLPAAARAGAQAVIDGLVARGLPLPVAIGLAANAVQESGANPNPRPGDGGRSFHLMQWNADRLAALRAQYGDNPTLDQQLDFTVAELRGSEARAGTALLAARTPEEAARLASTLYLRPRDTAAEEPRRAGIATTLAGGSGRDMALAEVRRQGEADGLPLHRVLHREALVSQWFAHEQAQQGQQRAALSADLHDLSATYQSGQTTAEIPEARIRSLLPPEQAQRTVDELQLHRATGQAVQAMATASPAEIDAMRTRLAGEPGQTYMAAERGQAVALFEHAMDRRNKALLADPHGFVVAADPAVRTLAEGNAPPQQIAAASIEAQRRMGVPESKQRILSNGQVAQIAETLRITDPATADLTPKLAVLEQQFGPQWGRAFGELVQHGKVPWPVQALAGMTAPQQAEGRARLQGALKLMAERGHDVFDKQLPADEKKALPAAIESEMAPFAEATRYHPGGDALQATLQPAVETLAKAYIAGGMKAPAAAQRAYQDVIGTRWDTAGDDGSHWFGSGATMLVPKGQAGKIETALDQVKSRIKAADLAPLADPLNPGASEQQLRDATLAAAQRGVWINNADASGAVLKARTPGGQIIDLRTADGKPIEAAFTELTAPPAPGAADTLTPQGRARTAYPLPPMLAR